MSILPKTPSLLSVALDKLWESSKPPKVPSPTGNMLLEPLVENITKNHFMDKVLRPRKGSVVYCGLLFGQEGHSGIYVGKRKIVSLSGDGEIVKETPDEFLDGDTTGDTIYVSCLGESPVGDPLVAERARKMVGNHRNYNFIWNNCHQFTSGCLTGVFKNADNSLPRVKATAERVLGADDTWRAWETR